MKARTLAIAFSCLMIASSGLASAAGDAVQIRQTQMKEMGGAFKKAVAMAKGQTAYDPAGIEGALAVLAKNARDFPNNFPEGSTGGDALPDIWTHFDDFKARSLQLADDADAAAKAGDAGAFKTAVMKVAKGCQSCHDAYRN